jgi:hypothetical protein
VLRDLTLKGHLWLISRDQRADPKKIRHNHEARESQPLYVLLQIAIEDKHGTDVDSRKFRCLP